LLTSLCGSIKTKNVGKNQLKHVETARDVASRFNHQIGDALVLPDAKIQSTTWVRGTDGGKSKLLKGEG
jgi:tryptophanyl-tRNA synthetase